VILTILSGTIALSIQGFDDQLTNCPKDVIPYSPHNLNPQDISLAATGFWTWPVEERKDCKWDVLDTNKTLVKGASVVYHNDEFKIKATGFTEFEKMYILKGANDSETFVYFSEKKTNGDAGNWKHTAKIPMKSGKEISVTINITNPYFSTFFMKNGIEDLKCDGEGCGCKTSVCNRVKNKLRIIDFEFDQKDNTFTLNLDRNFDYNKVYRFEMNLDVRFKSELTLSFN